MPSYGKLALPASLCQRFFRCHEAPHYRPWRDRLGGGGGGMLKPVPRGEDSAILCVGDRRGGGGGTFNVPAPFTPNGTAGASASFSGAARDGGEFAPAARPVASVSTKGKLS